MNKKYIIDEKIYYFDYDIFNKYFRNKKIQNHTTLESLENELSNFLIISKEAIHSWRFKKQSPSSLEMIIKISKYFDIKDYMILLKRKETKNNMSNFNQYQINSIKTIYDKIIEHLDYFYYTDEYNDLWIKMGDEGYNKNNIEDKLYEIDDEKINEVFLSYEKEKIFLKNTEIYDEIGEYIYNDLYDIFNGKLSYAYRFEAIPSNNPTTQEDYEKAIKKINLIIDKYI